MIITPLRTPGLGDTSYVVADGGVALVIDPQRDLDRFEAEIERIGADLRFVLETHVHNDYVSGGRHLARNHQAGLVLPAGSGAAFPYTPAFHHEEIVAGKLTVRPIHTPGHTPEHTSYLILRDDVEIALFSGGSLLVSSAGRTDLLGADRAEQLARLQYQSVNRLAGLDDDVDLYPTHGEGSFCTTTVAGSSASTIGIERRTNPVLQHNSADEFITSVLDGLEPYPSYYAHMGPINLLGPAPEPKCDLPVLRAVDLPEDVAVIDIRSDVEFAAGHLPGSIGIPASHQTGVWTGWLLPFGSPLVLVSGSDQNATEVTTQLARIGFDDVLGAVVDLEDAQLASYETVDVDAFLDALDNDGVQILDVRSPGEWSAGHIDGAIHRYVPDLRGSPPELDPDRDVWVVCESGYRATIAAGLLEQMGYKPVVLVGKGVGDVMQSSANRAR